MEDRIEEGLIKGSQSPKLLKDTYIKNLNVCICKVSGKLNGTGFFTKILYKNNLIPVLITNYHIIDDDFLRNNKFLNIYINNNMRTINISKKSKIYSSNNKEYDIMIIQLHQSDEIKNFLEIEQNIFNYDSENIYRNESIFVLHFPKNEYAMISYGCGIEKINDYDISHKCSTEQVSSGGPILNESSLKVIGIHKAYDNRHNFNLGTFLKFPLNEIYKKNNYIPKLKEIILYKDLKYILVGDYGSGKNDILRNIKKSDDLTIESYKQLLIKRENKRFRIFIWDTPSCFYICNQYIKNADCAIVVYNIANKQTFENIDKWIEICGKSKNIHIILVGNNFESKKKREVTYEEGQKLANNYNINFYEVSCITGENINEVIYSPLDYIEQKIEEDEENVINKLGRKGKTNRACMCSTT